MEYKDIVAWRDMLLEKHLAMLVTDILSDKDKVKNALEDKSGAVVRELVKKGFEQTKRELREYIPVAEPTSEQARKKLEEKIISLNL